MGVIGLASALVFVFCCFCNWAILIESGWMIEDGSPQTVADMYQTLLGQEYAPASPQ